MAGFFTELKRRNVFRVGIAYIVMSWVLLQIVDVVAPMLALPDWAGKLVLLLLGIGLPIALFFAWAFELTPEGLKREQDVDRSQSITPQTGRKLDYAIISLLVVAIGFVAVTHDWGGGSSGAVQPRDVALNSIAVLPFVNMSGDKENEYFSDGLSEELLNVLAKISELKVAGRTSSFAFKGKNDDLRTIGEKLDVATILEGSVRKAGDRVRITAQLVNTQDGYHLWSDSFDRELTDIFAIQEEIATEVVNALKITLLGEEAKQLSKHPTDNVEAYDHYLFGRQLVSRYSWDSLNEGEDRYQRALDLDPTFALAYVGIADANHQMLDTGAITEREAEEKVYQAIERALNLDPNLAEAYAVRAGMRRHMRDIDGAQEDLERALALNKNDSSVYLSLAALRNFEGRHDEAMELINKGLAIDPLSLRALQASAVRHKNSDRFDKAIEQYKKIVDLDPGAPQGYYGVGQTYQMSGQMAEGIRWTAKSAEIDQSDYEIPGLIADMYLDLGDDETAEKWMRQALEIGPGQPYPLAVEAEVHLARGELDEAVAISKQILHDKLDERQVSRYVAFRIVRDHAMRTGEYDEVYSLYQAYCPELLQPDPQIDSNNNYYVGGLAPLLAAKGDVDKAQQLLELAIERIKRRDPDLTNWYSRISVAKRLALKGDTREALDMLRRYVDRGERGYWWFFLEVDPALADFRAEPEYQAMVAEIREGLATQLALVREMEAAGEIPIL